jgi:hypothetical protein
MERGEITHAERGEITHAERGDFPAILYRGAAPHGRSCIALCFHFASHSAKLRVAPSGTLQCGTLQSGTLPLQCAAPEIVPRRKLCRAGNYAAPEIVPRRKLCRAGN